MTKDGDARLYDDQHVCGGLISAGVPVTIKRRVRIVELHVEGEIDYEGYN